MRTLAPGGEPSNHFVAAPLLSYAAAAEQRAVLKATHHSLIIVVLFEQCDFRWAFSKTIHGTRASWQPWALRAALRARNKHAGKLVTVAMVVRMCAYHRGKSARGYSSVLQWLYSLA